MTIVRKTVALHPIMDRYVRKLQAILLEKGWNATYSTALNYMILYQVFDIVRGKKERESLLRGFLEDTRTINELVKEDMLAEYLRQIRKAVEERYIA